MNRTHSAPLTFCELVPSRRAIRGFTLLEVMVALAILAVSLTAVFTINSSSIYGHVYAKKLTVATLLARSKMTDIEQELYDKGFKSDTDEQAGDFSDEGWPSFKWRAKIIAPKTQGLSPNQLIGAIFNFPMGGGSKDGKGGGGITDMFGSMFGGGAAPGGPDPEGMAAVVGKANLGSADGLSGAMGPMAGLMAGPFQQMVDQLTQAVREVQLTVTWKEGRINESFDIITHVVSLGPGSDRNGGAAASALAQAGDDPNKAGATYVNANTGAPVTTPIPCANGDGMCDADAMTKAIPKDQARGAAGIAGPNGSNNPLLRGPGGMPGGLPGQLPFGIGGPRRQRQ